MYVINIMRGLGLIIQNMDSDPFFRVKSIEFDLICEFDQFYLVCEFDQFELVCEFDQASPRLSWTVKAPHVV